MSRILASLFFSLALVSAAPVFSQAPDSSDTKPVLVLMETDFGTIKLELYPDKAPQTVRNFLNYAGTNFYNRTIFHRVIPGFMVQGGGFTETMLHKEGGAPIFNEAANNLKNVRGTIAMARTSDPHSASSQFFINTVDNAFLDYKTPTVQGFGYCVFGRVIEGMDVVDRIEKEKTNNRAGHANVPEKPIHIIRVTQISPDPAK